jgi:DUF3037 family protein
MQCSLMPYEFSIIRFVPDPARGEFVNIGAVAGNDEASDWELRLISNLSRAKALDDRGVLAKAFEYAASIQDDIAALEDPDTDEREPLTVALLLKRPAEMQNIVQLSAPAPVAADSATQALDLIFDHVILDAARKTYSFEKKHRAQGAVRSAYRAHVVPRTAIRERAAVRSSVFDGTFDFAIHNGRAIQLVQCWSFQLPNQTELAEQVKAWSWLVHELRAAGGEIVLPDAAAVVAKDLDIFAVTIPPLTGGRTPAYAEAQAAFAENAVAELSPEQADELGVRAAAALAAYA